MKNIIIFFVLLLSNITYGKSKEINLLLVADSITADSTKLPIVIDNSAFFPPARNQQVLSDCSNFSLIYYLKSAIWNKKYNRDPKLESNQFSHAFVWNQITINTDDKSNILVAEHFMEYLGCATVADFAINEQSAEAQPSSEIKERALSYKSKKLFTSCSYNYGTASSYIESLKDSLVNGVGFSMDIMLFDSFWKLSNNHNVYSCYGAVSLDSIKPAHVITVIGYNDTIKTALGRGAFMVIDSDTEKVSNGIFYLDYNWLYYNNGFWSYFLNEDYSNYPKMTMSIDLNNGISGYDMSLGNYSFVDTLITYSGKKFDFKDMSESIILRNQVQVSEINKSKVRLRNNLICSPLHSDTNNGYQIISDLSSIDNLKYLSVTMFDPISSIYIGDNDEILYSYTREANANIAQAYIHVLGTDKKYYAKVINLPDTTIIAKDFESTPLRMRILNPYLSVHVKSCTSVLKRKMITFTLEEETAATSDIEVPEVSVKVFPNPIVNNLSIEFLLTKEEAVKTVIYDYLGRLIKIIDNQTYYAGENTIDYDATSLSSGVYIIKFEAGTFQKSFKVVKH